MKQNFTTKTIDINSIYNNMKNSINKRTSLQSKQKELWNIIKRDHSNHDNEMTLIDNKIGKETHYINSCISSLCQYKKTHRAMKLAYDYLNSEINRINKIICSKEKLIRDVKCGITGLISSTGYSHTNPTNLENYVRLKKEQLQKLNNWKKHVTKYL